MMMMMIIIIIIISIIRESLIVAPVRPSLLPFHPLGPFSTASSVVVEYSMIDNHIIL